MDGDIVQLAKMMRARRAAGVAPYTLLLGSSLSLTPAVRRAVCDSEDWEAFWETVSRTSPEERKALMHESLSQLDLQPGCDALAQLVGAGYFNVVLTLNVDDTLDNALRTLPTSEYRVWVHGEVSSREIVTALDRPTPRIKVVKLHGDVNAFKLPLTPEATFEFPSDLEEALIQYLRHDTVIVGDLPFDDDVHRCIEGGDGALWVIAAEGSSFLEWAKRIRKVGEVLAATEFNAFFTALAEELGLGEAEEAAPEVAFVPPEKRVNPYRGLEPFEPEHTLYFFGREVLTEILVERLRDNRFLAVLGASGSGKSSVVRAGVLPALAQGQLPGSGNWPVLVIKPGQNPQEVLAWALAAMVSAARSAGAVDFARLQEMRGEIQERLLREESALHELVVEAVAKKESRTRSGPDADHRRVVVLVDQFEELFTLCPFEQRQRFIDALLYAVEQPDGHTTVLLTLRADFVAQCTAYPDLSDLISSHQVWARAMDDEGLRAAIERPAWLAGMRYEPGLVPLILADVGREPGALPLLEDALWSLFEYCKAGDEIIEAREYREIGGVQGALAKRADDVYATLSAEEQEDTRRILLRLVEMREGQEATRQRATLDELITAPEERALVEKVVQRLTDARLLTTTQDVETGQRVVDISHEALIRGWPRLREWLEESREDLLTYQQLREAAAEWERGERHESYLYHGARLAKVMEWRAAHEEERRPELCPEPVEGLVEGLNELEREFLDASVEVEERAAREEEARRQRELEQAQALAEEQRRRAEAEQQRAAEQRRRAEAEKQRAAEQARRAEAERQRAEEQAKAAGRFRRWAAVLAVVFLLAVGAAVYAGIQQQRAKNSAEKAVAAADAEATAHAEADVRRAEAVAAQETAIAERDRAEQQARRALSGQLAAQAQAMPEEYPQRSLLLAVEALNVTTRADEPRVPAAADALRQALANAGGRVLRGHGGAILAVAISPDNHWLVTGSYDKTARLWSVTNPTAEPVVLRGHEDRVVDVAFSPEGRWLATGSWDNTARLWDMTEPASAPVVLRGHEDDIVAVAFSPDGRWLVTGSKDNTARLWDVTELAAAPLVLRGHDMGVVAVAFSPDGRWLATGGVTTARLWDVTNPTAEPVVLSGHEATVVDVAFSPDGRWLATGGDTARLWDMTEPAAAPVVLRGHDRGVGAVAFSPDGRWLATGSGDTTARLWDVTKPAAAPVVLRGHESVVLAVAFSPDNHWLATAGSRDTAARLWDVTNPTAEPVVLRGHEGRFVHEGSVVAVAFSPDGRWLATGSGDATARLWDTIDPTAEPIVLSGHEAMVVDVAFSPDERWLATASWDNTARLWDMTNLAAEPVVLRGHEFAVEAVVFSPDGHWLVTGSGDGTARLWDVTNLVAEPVVLPGHEGHVVDVAFSPEGRWLATGSWDTTARLWDMSDLTAQPAVLRGHEDFVVDVDFSPDGRWLVTGSWDTTARLWDMSDLTAQPAVLRGHGKGIETIAFSPDGRWLVTGGGYSDNTARLWDLTAPDPAAASIVLRGHEAAIEAIAISPDNHWLVTGSVDSTARLWDLTASDPASTPTVLRGHEYGIPAVAFSPDGCWLVTGGDTTAQLWSVTEPTAEPMVLRGHESGVLAVAFSPDNHWLVTAGGEPYDASGDNTARLWNLRLDELMDLACRTAGRNLTRGEWEQYFPEQEYRKTCEQWPLKEE